MGASGKWVPLPFCRKNKGFIGFSPLPLSSVSLASAPRISGAEAREIGENRGNLLFVGSRSRGSELGENGSDLLRDWKG